MANCVGAFGRWVCALEKQGLLDVLLPFLLIFTISFAVLQKSKLLGEKSQRYNAILGFVLAMVAVIPHVLGTKPDIVPIINAALPNVSLLMIASLMVLLLIGVFGKEVNIGGTSLEGIVVLFSILAVTYTFLVSSNVIGAPPSWLSWMMDEETRALLVAILVFGIIVSFITSEEKPEEKRQPIYKTINDMFGGVMGKNKP